MKNRKKVISFLIVAILILLGRFFDVYTTYLYTPNLHQESNFLVKWFGAGWAVMITIQIILPFLIIGAWYYYVFKYQPSLPDTEGLSFKQVSSYLFYENTNSLHKLFYKAPKNKAALLASLGYVGSMVLIPVSFIVGGSTTLLLVSEEYKALYRQGIPYALYAIIILLAIFFYYKFLNRYYEHYKQRTTDQLS